MHVYHNWKISTILILSLLQHYYKILYAIHKSYAITEFCRQSHETRLSNLHTPDLREGRLN